MPVRRIWWVTHFLKFKETPHRQRFSADDEVKYATEEWLRAVKTTLFLLALKNSVIVTKICIDIMC